MSEFEGRGEEEEEPSCLKFALEMGKKPFSTQDATCMMCEQLPLVILIKVTLGSLLHSQPLVWMPSAHTSFKYRHCWADRR